MSQAKVNEQAADLLEAAALVIQLPGWWTKHTSARDASGRPVTPYSPWACKFCYSGGLAQAVTALGNGYGWGPGRPASVAAAAVDAIVPQGGVHFNDHIAKSGKQVAMLMLRAAQELRGEVSA